ncbi:MAG: hypothetical protein HYV19_09965 [Gemmatimonadetes bacterium]|nr:hypothetical protein [Gemmatimonadota bacterium]
MRIRMMGLGVLLVPALLIAQAKPAMPHDMSKMGQGQGMAMGDMKSGWAELDAFHSLLMSTWHPAMKDSLAMARTLAPQLVVSAEAWAKSKGPASCDNAAVRKALPGIVADAKAYAKVVADKRNDAAVKGALKKVHDGFDAAGKPCVQAAMKAKGGMGMGMGAMMGQKTGWKEFDALHTLVMNISSAANKGDLKPAREKGAELAKAADAWQASKGPATCDNAAARKGIPKAVADLKAIATLAKGQGNDAALKAAITKSHDSFRPVAQPCMMGGMAKATDSTKPAPAMDHSKMDHSKMGQPPAKKP